MRLLRKSIIGIVLLATTTLLGVGTPVPGDTKDRTKITNAQAEAPPDHTTGSALAARLPTAEPRPAWYTAGAESCVNELDFASCALIGQLIVAADVRSPNVELASAYLQQDCDANQPDACRRIGRTPRFILPQPPADADLPAEAPVSDLERFLNEQDCGSGTNSTACYRAGVLLLSEEPTKNRQRAKELFQTSCAQNNAQGCLEERCNFEADENACVAAAEAYLGTTAVTRNLSRAKQVLAESCARGNQAACLRSSTLPAAPTGPVLTALQSAHPKIALLSSWAMGCDRGVGETCRALAHAYLYGLGVDRDESRAAALWDAACSGQDSVSCIILGRRSSDESRAAAYFARALSLNQTACAVGVPVNGCFELAEQYLAGEGTEPDRAKALTLYQQSCDFWKFGWMCRRFHEVRDGTSAGVGPEEQRLPERATITSVALARDCDAGGPVSCEMLGIFYALGHGVARDVAHATALFTTACNAQVQAACTDLTTYGDAAAAAQGQTILCMQYGDAQTCVALAGALQSSSNVDDLIKAASLYTQACIGSNEVACQELARLADRFRTGDRIPADIQRAQDLYRMPCSVTHFSGCVQLVDLGQAALAQGVAGEDRAIAAFASTCGYAYQRGCDLLWSSILAHQSGPSADLARERELWQRVCTVYTFILGACGNYGVMLELGQGGAADAPRALALYAQDCAHGATWSCTNHYYLEGKLNREQFVITSPPVNSPGMTDIPGVTFRPNDQYYVEAGGCVQTGGAGLTWKRYVDPSGSDSDKYYYGTISVPGSKDLLPASPMRAAVNHWSVIANFAHYEPARFHLQLGYVDETGAYGDNGYYDHDDGTEDQCRGIGAAWVRITIAHHSRPPNAQEAPTTVHGPMDLTWTDIDDNLFPLNPKWKSQIDAGVPPEGGMLCNYFKNAGDRRDFGNCSTQDPHVDEPHPFTNLGPVPVPNPMYAVCHVPKLEQDDNLPDDSVHGHINWSAATYTGKLYFADFQAPIAFPPGDNDYDFDLIRPDEAGVLAHNTFRYHGAGNRGLVLEFDSREVIDKMNDGGFWQNFHRAVDAHNGGDWTKAQSMIDGNDAQVVGLVGIDTKHTFHSELHPVYALAVKVTDDANHEVWEFFARNRGDEGGCSQDQHYLPSPTVSFFFPDSDALVRSVDTSRTRILAYNAGGSWGQRHWDDGLTVTIPMPGPDSGGIVFGELQICKNACRGPETYALANVALRLTSDHVQALTPATQQGPPPKPKVDEGSLAAFKQVLTGPQWDAFSAAVGPGEGGPPPRTRAFVAQVHALTTPDPPQAIPRNDDVVVRRHRTLSADEPRVLIPVANALDGGNQAEQGRRYAALVTATGSEAEAKAALAKLKNRGSR